MLTTAEVRWFFPGRMPPSVEKWFNEAAPAAAVEPTRTDYYLNLASSEELGIKYRQGWLEVKMRQGSFGSVRFADRVSGELETWAKWGLFLGSEVSQARELNAEIWVPVHKKRRMVSYNLVDEEWLIEGGKIEQGQQGCEIELTEAAVGSNHWWTVALEATGKPGMNKMLLMEAAKQFFSRQNSPEMSGDYSHSYAWLISQNK